MVIFLGNSDRQASARNLLQSRLSAIYGELLNLAWCRRLKLCMTELVRNCPRQLVRVCVFLVVSSVTVRELMCEEWFALCRLGSIIWKRPIVLVTYLLSDGPSSSGLVFFGLFRRNISRGRLLRMRLGVAIMWQNRSTDLLLKLCFGLRLI